MPSFVRVYEEARKDEEWAVRIARARELGCDAIAEDTLEIADNEEEDPASRRVRAEIRLKLLAKWNPKRYGDTPATAVNVAVGVQVTVTEDRRRELAERRRLMLEGGKG